MRGEEIVVAPGGALPAQDRLSGAAAHPAAALAVREQLLECLAQFRSVADPDARAGSQQIVHRVAKAEVVGAEKHRHTQEGGFDYIVAALVAAPCEQAAAHVRDVGGAVQGAQFAHRIHQQHAAAPGRILAAGIDLGFAHDFHCLRLQTGPDASGLSGITRHQDEAEPRMPLNQRAVALGHDAVLAVAQASADDDHVLRRVVQGLPQIG